ncbi:zinc finger protein 260 [Parasteatoda tepidariorum]|uniref:zinc finger protein 260 n=1 Tax=Parasteatoda tepidariorum TaxID=114398 RepID=UPI00077FBC9A|nr:zinc finger protein 260 [Parasteatoda tepidariorum]
MAQVLLDQEQNQHRLKRSIFEIANRLITSDIQNDKTANRKQKKFSKIEKDYSTSDEESVDSPDLEDNGSFEEPNSDKDTEALPDAIQPSKTKSRGFSCTICGHVASSTERLKEHLSRHTGKKHLECEVCGKKFAWRYSFRSHVASHREDNPNKCSICGKKYCNKSSVKNHMIRVHGNPMKEFKCDKCNKAFVTKPELERHSYNHTKEKPFICEYCGNTYRFKAALVVHYRVHSGEKPYKCAFCDKAFIHLSSAIGHRRRHTGEMPYQCKECGKLFRVKRALTAHMTVHSDKRTYKCDKCEKSFKSRSGYRVHLDFHLDIKRHRCKYCDRSFRAWCNMHKHMKRHLNEKPHRCETCDRTFIEKQELRSHMKSHNNDKKCPKIIRNPEIVSNTCGQIMPPQNLCSAPNMTEQTIFTENPHPEEIIPPHIDISDSQAVLYDCNLLNSMDKCQTEKCQLLQDSYISQFLYPQHSSLQYASPSVLNMYSNDGGLVSNRSTCLSNLNTPNYNYMPANNQNYNGFSYTSTETLLSRCKLCRSLFHSSIFLRTHLLDYHRIEEEAIDEFMS